MVYLHLPDYREQNPKPLDIVGFILFGSGVALLSYVLEIFGDHTLGLLEILGIVGTLSDADCGLWAARDADGLSAAAADAVSHPHVQRGR